MRTDQAGFAPEGPAPGQPNPAAATGFPEASDYPAPDYPVPSGFSAPAGAPSSAPPWAPPSVGEQDRFEAFRPEAAAPAAPAAPTPSAAPEPEPPAPQVRNGRVLLAVLTAAVLILAVPLGLLTLLGKIGEFNPAIGSCVKQSGEDAEMADCGEPGAFEVVSKVDNKSDCPTEPYVEFSASDGKQQFLCLSPPGADDDASSTEPSGSTEQNADE